MTSWIRCESANVVASDRSLSASLRGVRSRQAQARREVARANREELPPRHRALSLLQWSRPQQLHCRHRPLHRLVRRQLPLPQPAAHPSETALIWSEGMLFLNLLLARIAPLPTVVVLRCQAGRIG